MFLSARQKGVWEGAPGNLATAWKASRNRSCLLGFTEGGEIDEMAERIVLLDSVNL